MEDGALGLSVSRNRGHYDPQGVHIPALWADEKEIFALADVLREMGTGIIQSGGGREAEMKSGLMARAVGSHRPAGCLQQSRRERCVGRASGRPTWTGQRNHRAGHPRLPAVLAEPDDADLQHEQFAALPRLADLAPDPDLSDEDKLVAYANPAIRQKLHEEMIE